MSIATDEARRSAEVAESHAREAEANAVEAEAKAREAEANVVEAQARAKEEAAQNGGCVEEVVIVVEKP